MTLEIALVDLLNRSWWALVIIVAGLGLYQLVNYWSLRRARSRTLGLESARSGIPVLLYFTTPDCMPCKTMQRPAILRLSQQLGDKLQVIEVDASQRPDLASYWGVMSVPTTFMFDANRHPRHVNHGVAPLNKLLQQYHGLE